MFCLTKNAVFFLHYDLFNLANYRLLLWYHWVLIAKRKLKASKIMNISFLHLVVCFQREASAFDME